VSAGWMWVSASPNKLERVTDSVRVVGTHSGWWCWALTTPDPENSPSQVGEDLYLGLCLQ
jgi:hypothetical protein